MRFLFALCFLSCASFVLADDVYFVAGTNLNTVSAWQDQDAVPLGRLPNADDVAYLSVTPIQGSCAAGSVYTVSGKNINGGFYTGTVYNSVTISGGYYLGDVVNLSTGIISGGIFEGKIVLIGSSSNLKGGTFTVDQLSVPGASAAPLDYTLQFQALNSSLGVLFQLLCFCAGLFCFQCAVNGKNARHLW